jgi:lipoprotein-releasing system permease protein
MKINFFRYFFFFIFRNKTRQKLIFLAVIGLLISSFSLTVLQGVMGGLQNGLVKRSQNLLGAGYIDVSNLEADERKLLVTELDRLEVQFVPELELELMIQNDNFVAPVILHGFDFKKYVPHFLTDKDKTGLIAGSDLARHLRTFYGSKVILTSPAHVDFIFRELPRQASLLITDFFSSELPEIDGTHGWVRIEFLQNMIRKRSFNKFRIFDENLASTKLVLKKLDLNTRLISWEEQNATLVFALNLETKVMLFLFIGMSILVGICITSGFLIFYNKVKVDLASFWILGLSKNKLMSLIYSFGHFITLFFCLLGVGLGILFLYLLDTNQFILMPNNFVERNIPVKFEAIHILIALCVPYFVSAFFTHFTFKAFKRDNFSFLTQIKRLS